MQTRAGFKLWQILYPIGMYYVISSLAYFVLEIFLGAQQETYMFRQTICSAATIPLTLSYYRQDFAVQEIVYGKQKQKKKEQIEDAVLAAVGAASLGMAVNNIIAMTPLIRISQGFQTANESFFAGTLVFELVGSCLVIPIAEELLFRGVVYKRLKLLFGITPALICSALLFGVMHVNLVQFIYASAIGLFLAFVLEKTGHISAAVIGHIAANAAAVLRTETGFLSFAFLPTAGGIAVTLILAAVGGFSVWRFIKKK